MTEKILVIGGGGREHALSWKLAQSVLVAKVYVAPGNAGTHNDGGDDNKVSNVAGLDIKDFDAVIRWCQDKDIGLVVIGPEDPLSQGIADKLSDAGIFCFGPSAKAAQIESSKDFSKRFMSRHSIPTAQFASFTDATAAEDYIQSADYAALVVKASGLAAGKGVVVAETKEQAIDAAKSMLQGRSFGAAGDTIVIEETLHGEEVSCLAFSDGKTISCMPPSQDHKRLLEGDKGPNTGGMGAYCPYPKITQEELDWIKNDVLQKAVDGLREEGTPFVGVLYAGIMLTKDGPKVLEFNCRFGDPETQAILPLLKSDLYRVCKACCNGTLSENLPEFDSKQKAFGIVVVSGGYPGSYNKGVPISGLEKLSSPELLVFHSGTAIKDEKVVTSGGRVMVVVGMDTDFEKASSLALHGAGCVKFDGAFHRKDIGYRILAPPEIDLCNNVEHTDTSGHQSFDVQSKATNTSTASTMDSKSTNTLVTPLDSRSTNTATASTMDSKSTNTLVTPLDSRSTNTATASTMDSKSTNTATASTMDSKWTNTASATVDSKSTNTATSVLDSKSTNTTLLSLDSKSTNTAKPRVDSKATSTLSPAKQVVPPTRASPKLSPKRLTYKDAGVNIVAGNHLVEAIKPLAKSTQRTGCEATLGMFGGMFDCKAAGFKDPILVSGTDGVGTKLKIAHECGIHNTVGIDLVAMCVNDILAHGAEPLYFLDYFACGKLNISEAQEVIVGIADGCRHAGCALLGGETAEMPGMYSSGEYDLAGFAVGAVERDQILPRIDQIIAGDVVIGLGSSGVHSNGFSLIRRVVEKLDLSYKGPSPLKTSRTLGEDLLQPTKIYVKSVLPLMHQRKVKAFAHITGGGLLENIPRILRDDLAVDINASTWNIPPVFGWIADTAKLDEVEMARTFNCGIGGVLIVDSSISSEVVSQLQSAGETATVIGKVISRKDSAAVNVHNLSESLISSWRSVPGVARRKRVGVLISGSGTNLQALIDHTRDHKNNSAAEIVLVISNKPGVAGLDRAEKAGIKTKVIQHQEYASRDEFDEALHVSLMAAGVEIVCLAGFMRILTGGFSRKWEGWMINTHPSLLPSFRGSHAHRDVLAAGVRVSGCTIHFVAEEVDAGAILVQEVVPVYSTDTEPVLADRVKAVEHKAYPKALELVASERVYLDDNGKIHWKM